MRLLSDAELQFLHNPHNFPCLCFCTGNHKYFVATKYDSMDQSVYFNVSDTIVSWVDKGYYYPILNYNDVLDIIKENKQKEIRKIPAISDYILALTELENIIKRNK